MSKSFFSTILAKPYPMFLNIAKAFLVCVSLWMLSGCQKEFSSLRRGSGTMDLEGFFKEITNSSTQSFALNTNSGGTIKGKNGSGFFFQPLSFVDLNGNTIRGNVNIDVLELLTPADIILNNAATMSDGLPLESGGAFYIHASFNNTQANLAPGTFVKIDLISPSASLPGMQVFTGYIQDTTGGRGQDTSGMLNWVVNNSPGNRVSADSLPGNGLPKLFSDSLEWINCDRYMNEPKIKCSFPVENNPDKDSTAMFIQFTGRNSVMRIHEDADDMFTSSVLVAGPATVVGICVKDRKLYTSIKAVSLKAQQSFTMKFSEDTEDALRAKLQLLK